MASSPDRGTVFPLHALRTDTGGAAPRPDAEALYAFFHTECPTSEMTIPFLERLREVGEGRGLRVVAVSQDDPAATEAFVSRLGLTVPVLYDPPPWKASEALGLASVPVFAAVSRDGRVERLVVGLQKLELEAFAERAAALAGRPSRPFFRPEENVPAIRPG
ncbi:MAG TPA: TlpA disulfide reductase family protein [Thermoanaerobaculia bacterium]